MSPRLPDAVVAALVGGILNGAVRDGVEAFAAEGAVGALAIGAGTSWLAWIGFAAALVAVARSLVPVAALPWIAATAAVAMVVPSSTVSWLATAIAAGALAAAQAARSRPACLAALAVAALSLREAAAPLALKILAAQVLAFDAALAVALLDGARLLGLLAEEVARSGNVLAVARDGLPLRKVVVLRECSSFGNLTLVLSCFAAFVLAGWGPAVRSRGAYVARAAALAAAVLALNTLRIAAMAADLRAYGWLHGSVGLGAFETVLVCALLAALVGGPAAPARERRP